VSVWERLVGQQPAVDALRAAAAAARALARGATQGPSTAAMTSSWLITGPAGSGRSVAALALAAALQCTDPAEPGCGHCHACHTVLRGSHPDVLVERPEGLSIGAERARALVVEAAVAPQTGSWRVLVIEDADRLMAGQERAANVLLKAVEEPAPRTVFLLCAPSQVDVPVTIRSRCRHLGLVVPSAKAVAQVLHSEGVDAAMASFAAHAAGGHVGRARRLATDEGARLRRAEVLRLPGRLSSPAACLAAARELHDACQEEAAALAAGRDVSERVALERSLGVDPTAKGAAARSAGAALKELERAQKSRGTRTVRDALDRALVDLAQWWRDVLVRQLGGGSTVHPDQADAQSRWVARSTAAQTLRRIDAIMSCRERLAANAAPLLALEAMCVELVLAGH
jgi:DNA polymerase-3 subunit delta'